MDSELARLTVNAIAELEQQLQDARAENARLEEQYQTTRDLLEYRTGQHRAMSKAAGEAEAERDQARRWEAEWMAGFVQVLEDYGEARRWARVWKRKAKQHRAVYKYYVGLYLAECERRDKLEAPQHCGHPGACIAVGESWGGWNVHSCGWCADTAKLAGALGHTQAQVDALRGALEHIDSLEPLLLLRFCSLKEAWWSSLNVARAALEATE